MKIARNLFFVALAAVASSFAAGELPTLCAESESVYLSCSIGEKLLSICGSHDLTKETGYLRYVFGEPGKRPEMTYPNNQVHPSRAFRRNEPVTSAKAGVSALAFDVSGFTYNVFSTRSAFGYNGAGVIVQKGDMEVARHECAPRTINDYRFFYDVGRVGIPIGSVRYIGPEA